MSDIDARDMLDNILDRLEASTGKAARQEYKADKLDAELRFVRSECQRWKKAADARNDEIGKLHSQIDRLKSLVPLAQIGVAMEPPADTAEPVAF